MSAADILVLGIITVILAAASTKILRDRRRKKTSGGPALCIGCPVASECSADAKKCSRVSNRPSSSCGCGCS